MFGEGWMGQGMGPGEFVAMPNHVHGIVWIEGPDAGRGRAIAPAGKALRPTAESVFV
jgi:hypothetical protein